MSVDELLPGEASLPRSRIMTRVPLEAFERIETDRALPENLDRYFLAMLFANSSERRNSAGASGLIVETAKHIIAYMLPDLHRLYQQRDIIVSVSEDELNRLANEFANEVMKRTSFRKEAIAAFTKLRDDVAHNSAYDEYLTVFGKFETELGTLNRWLDYVELQIKHGDIGTYIFVHGLLISCLRVYDAIFGTNNLLVKRG